jgi:translation initiation factor IF-3
MLLTYTPRGTILAPLSPGPLSTEGTATIRRPMRSLAPTKEGPQSNEDISSPEVQLIDAEGENKGAVKTRDAIAQAQELGLDLVIISPNSTPPVAKILDLGRFKFSAQKKAAEARKRQKVIEVKEIQLRPNIDTHDYETKMKAVNRFLDEGDRVKVTMRFRGREMAHQELGMQLLLKVRDQLEPKAKVESSPRSEGRQMVMVLAPK